MHDDDQKEKKWREITYEKSDFVGCFNGYFAADRSPDYQLSFCK